MKRISLLRGVLFAGVASLVVSVGSAQVPGQPVFEFRKLHVNQLSSPSFQGSNKSFSYTESSGDWLQLVCEFRVADKELWLDNVEFKWHVLIIGAETERLVLGKTIIYDSIEADGKKSERAVVYLAPRDIRRYISARGSSISSSRVVCVIEALVNNVKVAEFRSPDGRLKDVPDNWWLNRQANRVENALKSRRESPWANLDWDTWAPERAAK